MYVCIKVQGRFLRDPPAGQIFIGAETTRPMKLSLFERALGNSFLQIGMVVLGYTPFPYLPHTCIHTYIHMHTYSKYIYTCILVRISKFMHSEKFPLWKTGRSLHPLLHYAFGDSSLRELPHITAPLWSFVDRLVVFITNHS